jgi:hypothetical protein
LGILKDIILLTVAQAGQKVFQQAWMYTNALAHCGDQEVLKAKEVE